MEIQIELNSDFQKALDLFHNTNKTIFITGEAGTGKSTLLNQLQANTKKALAVVAPTGVAAVNVSGETIHSFFGFRPDISPADAIKVAGRSKKKEVMSTLQTLIIDEVSMVRADLLDSIDVFLRNIRKNPNPFGGVQLILIGDLYQLPPVVNNEEQDMLLFAYTSPYFFSSLAFEALLNNRTNNFEFIELTKVYRQKDPTFIDLLNKIRNKTATPIDLSVINKQAAIESPDSQIVLTTTNYQADQLNQTKLSLLSTPSQKYSAVVTGDFPPSQQPTSTDLVLKVGSRVMLLNNDTQDRWINGTLGTIVEIKPSVVKVELDQGNVVTVEPFTWNQYQTVFDQETNSLKKQEKGSFTQLPLRLAWAVTIHKAQGKTFDNVHINLGRATFAHGQAYVALSRCRTLEGITLTRPINMRDLILDPSVVRFLNQLKSKILDHASI